MKTSIKLTNNGNYIICQHGICKIANAVSKEILGIKKESEINAPVKSFDFETGYTLEDVISILRVYEEEKIRREKLEAENYAEFRRVSQLVSDNGKRIDCNGKKISMYEGNLYQHVKMSGWERMYENGKSAILVRHINNLPQIAEDENLINTTIADYEGKKNAEAKILADFDAIKNNQLKPTGKNIEALLTLNLLHGSQGGQIFAKFGIGYSLNFYDCDGKIAVAIKFDKKIKFEKGDIMEGFDDDKFSLGNPHGHLSKYQRVGKSYEFELK